MLYHHLLINELHKQREDFTRFDRSWRDEVEMYALRLRALAGRTALSVLGDATSGENNPGALPSAELDAAGSMIVPFSVRWRTHEEARRWAIEALQERTTFAADGSQLLLGREVSIPVAAVQVACFENPHTRAGVYRKEARFRIVSPRELLEGMDERINAETIVGLHRFRLEIEEIGKFLESKKGWQSRKERTPVAFFDGTLLISLALPKTKIQNAYVGALVELIKLSRETQVPIVGYIDQSYARDLVRLLNALDKKTNSDADNHSMYDTQFLHARIKDQAPLLEAWGDRTSFCYSLREGFEDEANKPLVGFTYLQTTGEGAPARLDVPAWIYEAGLLDDVVDAVRAECVGGLGYPYAIETADEAAVITAHDRQQFLRAISDFAGRENIAFSFSRKSASKVRRR
jgi:hypothetical protein